MSVRRELIRLGLLVCMGAGVVACVLALRQDDAEHAYMTFLRSDEDGSTLAQRRAHIDRAIGLAPNRARYLEARGTFRMDLHDTTGALADLDRAIVLEDRPYLRYLRALTLCRRGEYARALPDLDHAIAAQPDNTQFYRGRALARIEVGRARDALTDGMHMVADAPHWGVSYFTRGAAHAALGNAAAALADFEQASRRSPELVYVRRARVEVCQRLGDEECVREEQSNIASRTAHAHPGELDPFHY